MSSKSVESEKNESESDFIWDLFSEIKYILGSHTKKRRSSILTADETSEGGLGGHLVTDAEKFSKRPVEQGIIYPEQLDAQHANLQESYNYVQNTASTSAEPERQPKYVIMESSLPTVKRRRFKENGILSEETRSKLNPDKVFVNMDPSIRKPKQIRRKRGEKKNTTNANSISNEPNHGLEFQNIDVEGTSIQRSQFLGKSILSATEGDELYGHECILRTVDNGHKLREHQSETKTRKKTIHAEGNINEWEQSHEATPKKKKPINGFMAFMSHKRGQLTAAVTMMENKEFIKKSSIEWREMSLEEQNAYKEIAKRMTCRRNEELINFQQKRIRRCAPVQLEKFREAGNIPNAFVWEPLLEPTQFDSI